MDASPEMERLKTDNLQLRNENQRLIDLLSTLTARCRVLELRIVDHENRLIRIEDESGTTE